MTYALFKVGDRVKKRSGYEYPGFIVSVFTNRAGALRYLSLKRIILPSRACCTFSMAIS
jgi:hypothetical protein